MVSQCDSPKRQQPALADPANNGPRNFLAGLYFCRAMQLMGSSCKQTLRKLNNLLRSPGKDRINMVLLSCVTRGRGLLAWPSSTSWCLVMDVCSSTSQLMHLAANRVPVNVPALNAIVIYLLRLPNAKSSLACIYF
jgi:hypothetical protein